MLTFRGEFSTNFQIPDYLGLGKQVARGYGMVKKKDELEKKKLDWHVLCDLVKVDYQYKYKDCDEICFTG